MVVAFSISEFLEIPAQVSIRVEVRVRVTVRVTVRVRTIFERRSRDRARVDGVCDLGGLLPATSHSIFYTTVNAEGSPSGGLSWDICRHRMGPHSNDAGTLAA